MTYKTRTKGFRVTGVAGLERIEIDPVVFDENSYAEITVVDTEGVQRTFDLEGLQDLIAGLEKAENLARRLNEELDRNQQS